MDKLIIAFVSYYLYILRRNSDERVKLFNNEIKQFGSWNDLINRNRKWIYEPKMKNGQMKVYRSIQTYDSRTGKINKQEQYDEYLNDGNKWINIFSKNSGPITKQIDFDNIDDNDNNEEIDYNDYAFKLDKIEGGNAYYKLVKLTDEEKEKLDGGEVEEIEEIENSDSEVQNINQNVDLKNINIENTDSEIQNINQNADSETQNSENTNQNADSEVQNINTEVQNSENTNLQITNLVSQSFTDLSIDSFSNVNNLTTISINGMLKTIGQDQLNKLKEFKNEIKTLSKDVVSEITNYIKNIITTFSTAISKIIANISSMIANPIDILIKWLKNPKTIPTLGATAIKVGIKNVTNIVKIIRPKEFFINMIYNDVSAFITILRTFYNAVIYSQTIKLIKNAFNSIIQPFKEDKLKYIIFLKPYISGLFNVINELFQLATPRNLEKLLQDCIKIIFNKNKDDSLKEDFIRPGRSALHISGNKKKLKEQLDEILNVLKQYVSKLKDSIITFGDNFKAIFEKVQQLIMGDIDDYSVPDEELGTLDF